MNREPSACVPAAATIMCHDTASKSLRPASLMVGISGSAPIRVSDDTASGRNPVTGQGPLESRIGEDAHAVAGLDNCFEQLRGKIGREDFSAGAAERGCPREAGGAICSASYRVQHDGLLRCS